ncbi:protein kinase domain-containing protein [Tabrizicola flagellatus]|uniref:protein kinase domain-containing protein n=1 Tax=Tabrizicola flagellatus TaxID=2593021 RepID=UPI0011F2E103|nr:protein kinase [Tabrizicola flagellatus]
MAQQKAAEPAVDEVDDLIDELQPGTKLLKGQYTITRYINSGGFGITYLAKDSLDRDVVIKECFPSSVCRRSKVMVAARSRAHSAELRSIVQLFVREARSLAKIVHPNIVAVHQVFEDNGTAYMAIDYIDGMDLQQIIDGEGAPLSKQHIVEITTKLLKAVGFIHENDMLHRDISPDNVLIDKAGEPILIDFGAAREKASQTNRAMSALRVVKDGYSPQEFYIAGSEQGPWSDLYALAATLYHVISGEAPVNGQARLAALAEDRPDPFVPLSGRIQGYPKGFLEAIDKALNTLPKQRIQSAAEWLTMYDSSAPFAAVPAEPAPGTEDAVHRLVRDFRRDTGMTIDGISGQDRAMAVPAEADLARAPSARAPSVAAPNQEPAARQRGRGSMPVIAGVAVAVAVAAGGFVYLSDAPVVPEAGPDSLVATATEVPAAVPAADVAVASPDAPETPAAVTDPAPTPPADQPASPVPETEGTEAATRIPAATPTSEPPSDPAPATAAETGSAATDSAPVADQSTDTPAEATVAAAQDPATAADAPAAPEASAAVTPATESPTAPAGAPAPAQVAFAVWDAVIPFTADDRIVGGKPVAQILRISPEADLASAGPWLQQGMVIHSINGSPTPTAKALTAAILNAMQVDGDGKARMVADYSTSNGERNSGLLTVDAQRLVTLANGIQLRTLTVDGVWKTEVTGVAQQGMTTLRPGDLLFRDKSTGVALDGPTSIEDILGQLVDRKATRTEFSIVRDNKVETADMNLALAAAP